MTNDYTCSDKSPKPVFFFLNARWAKHISVMLTVLGLFLGTAQMLHAQLSSQTFSINGNFTVPPGVTSVRVAVWGGGGAGGGVTGANARGGGGGGGAYQYIEITGLTPGASIPVTVGTGGTGVSAGNGNNGAASSFGGYVTAVGGFGGAAGIGTNAAGAGGAGGLGVGLNSFSGGDGSAASGTTVSGAGGGGAGTGDDGDPAVLAAGGNGGIGGTPPGGTTPTAGGKGANGRTVATGAGAGFGTTQLAAGGGGARNSTLSQNRAGGAGARGRVIVYWCSALATPTVAITANPSGPICEGTEVTFTAVGTNGGTAPTYEWFLNGVTTTQMGTSYTNSTLNDEDEVYCVITSNQQCVSTTTAQSNTITMDVEPPAPASISYSPNPKVFCQGVSVPHVPPVVVPAGTYTYSIFPTELPDGLTFSTSTGQISGTPTAAAAAQTYTVTVSNSCGSTEASLIVSVQGAQPVNAGEYGPLCVDGPDIALSGLPLGGMFAGEGVSGNMFDPSAGISTTTKNIKVFYTIITPEGCPFTDSTIITIYQDGTAFITSETSEGSEICQGESIDLKGHFCDPADVITQTWTSNNEDAVNISSAGNPDEAEITGLVVDEPTAVTITYTVNGTQTATYVLTVLPTPTLTCPENITVKTGDDTVNDCFGRASWSHPAIAPDEDCGPYTLEHGVWDEDDMEFDFSLASSVSFPVLLAPGSYQRAYRLLDGEDDQVRYCEFSIIVEDNVKPTLNCPAPINVQADGFDCEKVVTYSVTVSDDCGATHTITNPAYASGEVFASGTTTVEWTAVDDANNSTSCSFTITVTEIIPPNPGCPESFTAPADANACDASVEFEASPTDFCNLAEPPVEYRLGSGTGPLITSPHVFPLGNSTVWVKATDASGNTNVCTFVISVEDQEDPRPICPEEPIEVSNAEGQCGANVPFNVNHTDNCFPIGSSSASPAPNDFFDVGTTMVTITATDNAGNTASCTFYVVVNDEELPVANCPEDKEVDNDPGDCGAIVEYVIPDPTDNCPAVSSVADLPSGNSFSVGTTTVTVTATDNAGLEHSCTFTITVNDTEAPEAACQDVSVELNEDGVSTITAEDLADMINDKSSDNCDVDEFVVSLFEFNCNDIENNPLSVTLTVTDESGNTSTCVAQVTVEDDIDPSISCPDPITDGQCNASSIALGTPTTSDNCTAQTPTNNAPMTFGVGMTPVTWTVTDQSGNSSTCLQVVTIVSNPTASISGDATVCEGAADQTITFTASGGTGPYIWTYQVNGGGNQTVSGTSPQTQPQSAGASGSFVYTLISVSDQYCTATASGTATVHVNEPATVTIEAYKDAAHTMPILDINNGGNTCASPDLIYWHANVMPATPNSGSYTYQWGAFGTAVPGPLTGSPYAPVNFPGGNVQSPSRAFNSGNGAKSVSVRVFTPECPVPSDMAPPLPYKSWNQVAEPTAVTTTITDNNPTDDCPNAPHTLTVAHPAPLLTVGGVTWSGAGSGTDNPYTVMPAASATYNVSVTFSNWGCDIASDSYTVTVLDNTPPSITTCPVTRTIEGCNTGIITSPAFSASATSSSYAVFSSAPNDGVATDDCPSTNFTVTYQDVSAPGTCPNLFVITRTWTVTDAGGGSSNSTSCVQTINIKDETAPTGTAPAGTTDINACYIDGSTPPVGAPAFNATTAAAGYTDNCGGPVTATLNSTSVTGDNCAWTLTYIFTVTDGCNNALTNQMIVHKGGDKTAPTGTAPLNVSEINGCKPTQTEANNAFNATMAASGYSDGCVGNTVIASLVSADITGTNCSWTVTYTFNVTDNCGNTLTNQTYTRSGFDQTKPVFPALTDITITTEDGASCPGTAEISLVEDRVNPYVTGGQATTYTVHGTPQTVPTTYSDACTPLENMKLYVWNLNTNVGNAADGCQRVMRITWRAEDECGNTRQQVQDIIIQDKTAPVLIDEAPVGTSEINACFIDANTPPVGTPSFDAEALAAYYKDECGNTLEVHQTHFIVEGDNCSWTATYTYDVIDACGNSLEGQTISHSGGDKTPPTGTPPADITTAEGCMPTQMQANEDFDAEMAADDYTDNCGGTVTAEFVSAVITPESSNCNWAVTYTFKVKDACGNFMATDQTYTVSGSDNTPPVLMEGKYCDDLDMADVNECLSAAEAFDPVSLEDEVAALYEDACGGTVTATYDDGETLKANLTEDAPNSDCAWSFTYSFIVEDACGNSTLCSVTRSGGDTEDPVLVGTTTCYDLTPGFQNLCNGAYDPTGLYAAVEGLYNDNCDIDLEVSHTNLSTAEQSDCAWSYTYEFKVTDNCDNSATCQITVSGGDQSDPELVNANTTCASLNLSDQNFCDGGFDAESLISEVQALYQDNCDEDLNVTLSNTFDSPNNTDCSWTYTYEYTIEDGCDNSTTCTVTVSGGDDEEPELAGKDDCATLDMLNVNACDGGFSPGTLLDDVKLLYQDNCTDAEDLVVALADTDSGENTNCSWSYTYTFTVTDNCQNSTSCTVNISGGDDTPPSLTGSPYPGQTGVNACVSNAVEKAPFNAENAVIGFTDNCGGTVTAINPVASSVSEIGNGWSFTWSYQVTDACGNSSSVTASYTVSGQGGSPTITCPANQTVNAATGTCSSVATYDTPTATDACGGAIPSGNIERIGGLASGSTFTKANNPNVVTYMATDEFGNTHTCSFTITVNDNQLPVITCPADRTVNAPTGSCSANVSYTILASDNCSPPPTLTRLSGLNSGSAFPRGTTVVTWRASDGAGNSSTCSFRVTVRDAQPPSISCPANRTVNMDLNLCTSVQTFATPSASDNCAGATVARTTGLASGSAFPKGTPSATNVITFRATDAGGNTASCSFSITVVDNQLPSISCPSNIQKNNDPNSCGAVVNYTTPVGSDNCTGVTVTKVSGPASGAFFTAGTTTVVWRATDASGNSTNSRTCSFTVQVNDTQAPNISCPANTTVTGIGSPNCSIATSSLPAPTASDNCAVTQLTSVAPPTLSGPGGPYTITWTARDAAANTNTCSYSVVVLCGGGLNEDLNDRTAPGKTNTGTVDLYPNPTNGLFNLVLQGFDSQALVQIFDATGRNVWQMKVDAKESTVLVDLSSANFSSGLYMVTVTNDGTVVTKRLTLNK